MPIILADQVLAFVASRDGSTNRDIREALCPGAETYVPEIDRAIQVLRKERKIQYEGGRWIAGNLKTCPRCKGSGVVR